MTRTGKKCIIRLIKFVHYNFVDFPRERSLIIFGDFKFHLEIYLTFSCKFVRNHSLLTRITFVAGEDYTEWADLFKTVDQVFAKNNLHPASCLQRIVCWLVRNASGKVARGSATSTEKIIDGITTSDWFKRIIDESIFETAVRSGLSNSSCTKRFHKCKISQRNLEIILKDLFNK